MAMSKDIAVGGASANFKSKCKTNLKSIKISSKLEIADILHIKYYIKDSVFLTRVKNKAVCLIKENSSSSLETVQLHSELIKYIRLAKERRKNDDIGWFNGYLGRWRKVWSGSKKGMPVKESSLESAVGNGVFDMSCLSESLPCRDADDIKMKARKLSKKYLNYQDQLKKSYRELQLLKILTSKVSEQNKSSSSTNPFHWSLNHLVKKVYGHVKNVRIYLFRPIRTGGEFYQRKKVKKQDAVEKWELQNGPLDIEKLSRECDMEQLFVLRPRSKTKTDKLKDDSNLQNPERLLLNRGQQHDDKQKNGSLRTQQLRDSISLDRQLSRLKITNSNRSDLSEAMGIAEASTNQNDNEQEKVGMANRRREVVAMLREQFQRYTQQTTETLKN